MYSVQGKFKKLLLDPLRLRPDVGYAIGVELGPRNARVAIADIHGQLFEHPEKFERHFKFAHPPEEYLDWVAPKIDELVREAGVEPREILGVGISQVGPINTSTGHPHPAGLVNKSWRDVNVGDQLARRLVKERSDWASVPTGTSDNDTNLSALAEHTFGNAQGVEHLVYVNWSNHVGFGLILGGAPYRGGRGYAGELGHLLIEDHRGLREQGKDEEPCRRCGKVGCLEARIGAARIAEAFGAGEDDMPTAADYILDRASAKRAGYQADVRSRVEDAARLLGESVASIVNTLDPSVLILGGSVGERIHDDTALLKSLPRGARTSGAGLCEGGRDPPAEADDRGRSGRNTAHPHQASLRMGAAEGRRNPSDHLEVRAGFRHRERHQESTLISSPRCRRRP